MLRDTTRREAPSVMPGPSQPLISVICRSTATNLRPSTENLQPLKKRRVEVVYWTTKIRQMGKVTSPNKAGLMSKSYQVAHSLLQLIFKHLKGQRCHNLFRPLFQRSSTLILSFSFSLLSDWGFPCCTLCTLLCVLSMLPRSQALLHHHQPHGVGHHAQGTWLLLQPRASHMILRLTHSLSAPFLTRRYLSHTLWWLAEAELKLLSTPLPRQTATGRSIPSPTGSSLHVSPIFQTPAASRSCPQPAHTHRGTDTAPCLELSSTEHSRTITSNWIIALLIHSRWSLSSLQLLARV